MTCRKCKGSGRRRREMCRACGGTGAYQPSADGDTRLRVFTELDADIQRRRTA